MKGFFMEGKYLVEKYLLKIEHKIIETHAFIDYKAYGIVFIDKDLVYYFQIEEQHKEESRKLGVIEGRPIKSETITTIVNLHLGIGCYQKKLSAFVSKSGHYPIVSGLL